MIKRLRKPVTLVLTLVFIATLSLSALASPVLRGDAGFTPLSDEEQRLSDDALRRVKAALKEEADTIQGGMGPLGDTDPTYIKLSSSAYIRQPDDSTCGPTSMRNALTNWGVTKTVDQIKPEIDWSYASGTAFNSKLPAAMNKFTGTTGWVRTAGPSKGDFWSAITWSTQQGAPILINVYMIPDEYHLKGYKPEGEYGHYVTGTGYQGTYSHDYSTIFYHDPFDYEYLYGTVWEWGNPYGDKSDTLANFTFLVASRGIVWYSN